MDVIGDTELAIDAYLDSIDKPATTGDLYIFVYGILQVLFVQQNAVKDLAESLNLKYEPSKTLAEIREIRNDSIGHPTMRDPPKKGQEREKWSNFITRVSMSKNGFTLITTYPNRSSIFKKVDICQLIGEQREALRKILTEVITCLKREAMEHKNKFKGEKLADIFPETLHYFCDKVTEAIFGGAPAEFGLGALNVLADVVYKFREALETRQIFEAYNMADDFELTEYSLLRVRQYFDGSGEYSLNDKDAYIYLSFARKKSDELQQIAKEIDEDYEIGNQISKNSA